MLARLFGGTQERAITSDPWGGWPGDAYGSATWSGVRVDSNNALQLLTVYGCVRLISDSISTLPVDCYRQNGDERTPIPTPEWLRKPTPDLDFPEWCTQVLASLLLHGNAYLAVLRSQTLGIVELAPLDPTQVSTRREQGRKVFVVNGFRYGGEIVHIKGLMLPAADTGLSPIEYARQSIGLGLATQEFGAKFFAEGANMPGVIESPKPMQPDAKRDIALAWKRKRTKGNSGLPGVLDDGATWKPTGVTNEQAQFLETRNFTAAEIAGQLFLVDPSDLGIGVQGTSLTYANLEQRNARRLQVTLLPWIVRIERALSALMLNPRYMKFNVNGLLRGDLKTRYESYKIGLDSGFLHPDEPRAWEELPPRSDLPQPAKGAVNDDVAA